MYQERNNFYPPELQETKIAKQVPGKARARTRTSKWNEMKEVTKLSSQIYGIST